MKRVVVSVVLLCAITTTGRGQATKPPEPRMSVLVETTALVPNESARVRIWIENPDALPLSPLRLQWSGPAFLQLGAVENKVCTDQANPKELTRLPGKSVISLDLCVRSTSVVVEGTFTVGFTLLYGRGGTAASSYLLVEKTLTVGLFGNDAVAGVSLRLASFIVPGLLFLFLLQVGKVGALATLDTLKLSTLSVVFSLLLTLVAAKLKPLSEARGVSILRFAGLCGAAVALGLLVLAIKWMRTTSQARRAALASRAKVTPTDDDLTALGKAVAASGATRGPVLVTLMDGRELIGSVASTTSDGGHALLGWFEVPGTGSPELAALATGGDYPGLVRQLSAKRLIPTLLNGIRERVGGVVGDVTGAPAIMRFGSGEVRSIVPGPIAGVAERGPIEVR